MQLLTQFPGAWMPLRKARRKSFAGTLSASGCLEWYGGHDPDQGDILVGDYESYGFKDIYNETASTEFHVYVDDYGLGKSRALEKYYDKCH